MLIIFILYLNSSDKNKLTSDIESSVYSLWILTFSSDIVPTLISTNSFRSSFTFHSFYLRSIYKQSFLDCIRMCFSDLFPIHLSPLYYFIQ